MNWLISDTHFNHRNIIEYCNRPFGSVEEMNRTLVGNWNKTVADMDTVFFLGDLALDDNPLSWLGRLNGHIVLIRGSHDTFSARETFILYSDNLRLLLIHNPADVPKVWDGWVIHGHKHNAAPFIDPIRRRVNVSVEVINYRPVSVSSVVSKIKSIEEGNPRPTHLQYRRFAVRSSHRKVPLPQLGESFR